MTRVLLVGESWVSISTHYKGFNHFVSGVYETGLKWFSQAMDEHGIELTHMPAHKAANDFPFTVGELDYDVIILSDSSGTELARGLTNYSAADLDKIRGLKTDQIAEVLGHRPYDEVVHRDNLTVTG